MLYLASSKTNIDTAYSYKYVREIRNNRSPEIDLWNKFVGNALGSPYCAAFVSYCNSRDIIPFKIKSGLARTFWTKAPKELKHTAKDVLTGKYKPKYSDLIIWANGNTITGHIGFVLYSNENNIVTIEANTSSGNSGSQSNGNGVFIRIRKIELYKYFHIIGFVETQ